MSDPEGAPEQPPTPERLAPRLGLKAQAQFLTSIIMRAKMTDGKQADLHLTHLSALDRERLADCADTLDWLYLERLQQRTREKQYRK